MRLSKIFVFLLLTTSSSLLYPMQCFLNKQGRDQFKTDLIKVGAGLGFGLGLYFSLNRSVSLTGLCNLAKNNPKIVATGGMLGLGVLMARAYYAANYQGKKSTVFFEVTNPQAQSVVNNPVMLVRTEEINAEMQEIRATKDELKAIKSILNRLKEYYADIDQTLRDALDELDTLRQEINKDRKSLFASFG